MNTRFFLYFVVGVLAIFQVRLAEANLIVNGAFDDGLNNWGIVSYIGNANVRVVSENGNYILEQYHGDSNAWTSIGQEIISKLTIGQNYELSFDFKGFKEMEGEGKFSDADMIWHSTSVNGSIDILHPFILDGAWHSYNVPFTVSETHPRSDEPLLAFILNYDKVGSIFLDNISVVAVSNSIPEPSTLALIIAGIIGAGMTKLSSRVGRANTVRRNSGTPRIASNE